MQLPLLKVAGLGAFGAVLGLSTLSFVDEPGDHLKNIVTGGAIGIIIGVGLVAFNQATKSKDLYDENASLDNFNHGSRVKWHTASSEYARLKSPKLNQVNFTFQF